MARVDGQAVVEAFFDRLSARDLEGFLALWTRDAVMVMPFAAPGLPDVIDGGDALRAFWTTVHAETGPIAFEALRIEGLADQSWFMSRQEGRIQLADGRPYENRYICLFQVIDGRIRAYYEYYNPLAVMGAFGDAETLAGKFAAA